MVLALATAVRVVDRVHDGTADGRAHVHVTLTAGLADDDIGVIGVADLTDGGAAGNEDAAHLGGRHTDDSVLALLTHQLAGVTGRTGDSSALPGWNSTAWMSVPTGMSARGRALPGLMSASEPDMMV